MKLNQGTTRKLAATFAVIGLVTLGATGCSSSEGPSVSASPSATPTPLTGAEAIAAFKSIAQASADQADKVGLIETTSNSTYGDYILVLDRNYNPDYQAAVQNADGTYALIYESDAFAPAAALSALDLGATVEFANGLWSLTEIIEGTPTTYKYTVVDGLIASESGSSGSDTWTSKLSYGMTADGHSIIDEALKTLDN